MLVRVIVISVIIIGLRAARTFDEDSRELRAWRDEDGCQPSVKGLGSNGASVLCGSLPSQRALIGAPTPKTAR